MNLTLTKSDIEKDIKGFEDRIATAQNKLDQLPTGSLPYHESKKRKHQRRKFKAEIKHVKKLISYAKEAINCSD